MRKLFIACLAAGLSLLGAQNAAAAFSPFTTTDKVYNCRLYYSVDVRKYPGNYSDPISTQFTSRSGATTTSQAMHDRLERLTNNYWRGGYVGLSHGQYNSWTEDDGTRHCTEMQEGNATAGPVSSRFHIRWNNGGRVPYASTTVIGTPHHDHFCLKYNFHSHEVDDWVGARTRLVNLFRNSPYERRWFYKGNYQKRWFGHCIYKETGSDGYVVRTSGP